MLQEFFLFAQAGLTVSIVNLARERDLDAAKSKACGDKISAASDSLRGDGTVNLFIGAQVFIFDPKSKELESYFDIRENFHNIGVPIGAAAASKRGYSGDDFILLTQGNKMYAYTNSEDGRYPSPVSNETLYTFDRKSNLPLGGVGPIPDCMAAMCESNTVCYYWRIYNTLTLKTMYCVTWKSGKNRKAACQYDRNLIAPKNMDSEMVARIKTPCEAMAITYDSVNDETALTYVDATTLHYYVNNRLLYSITISELFSCSIFLNSKTLILAAVGSVGSILLFAAIYACIFTRPREWHDREMPD